MTVEDARRRVVAYARQSISRLPDDSLSIAFQLQACREYAARQGWVLVGEYSDPDTKGWKRNRPGFDAMLATIADGTADACVIFKLSRFARNLMMQEDVVTLIADAGGDLVSVTEPHVSTSPMVRQILGAVNEQYRRDQGEWQRATNTARARKGQHLGYAPYGYRIEAGQLVTDDATAVVARQVWDWALAGHGMVDIAYRLNEAGHVTQRGKAWQPDAIRLILRNPAYAGHVRHRGEIVARDAHPAIVSDAEWDAVQALIDRRSHLRRKSRPSWAEGFVWHACGRRMSLVSSIVDGVNRPQFRCMLPHSHRQRGKTTCGHAPQSRYAHLVEPAIVAAAGEIASRILPPDAVVAALRAQAGTSERQRARERTALDRRLGDLERQRERLLDLVLAERIDADLYRSRDDAIKAEIERVTAERDAVPAPVDPVVVAGVHAHLRHVADAIAITARHDPAALVDLLTALDARWVIGPDRLTVGDRFRDYVR